MKSKKVRRVLTIIATLFLVTGIGLVLFPPVSNTYGKYVAKGISDDFETRANHPKKAHMLMPRKMVKLTVTVAYLMVHKLCMMLILKD